MSVKLISYDLHKPGQEYTNLINAIKEYGTWCHLHDSVWLVSTSKTSEQVFYSLNPHIDSNDSLYVCEVTPASSVWIHLSEEKNKWIFNHCR